MTKLNKSDRFVKELLAVGAPRYKGRTIYLKVSDPERSHSLESYWSEGYRGYHTLVNLDTLQTVTVPQNGTMFDTGTPYHSKLPNNVVIVTHQFAGTRQYVSIQARADNVQGLLQSSNA